VEEEAMSLYSIALFLHIVGALLLFVTLTVEGLALRQLHRAATTEAIQGAATILRVNRIVGPASALGVLIPGVYMTATTWGWVAWILVALAAWVLIAVLGAVNGIRLLALERRGVLTTATRNPLFVVSWFTRVGIALGVVFLMSVKPGAAAAVLAIGLAAGAGAGLGIVLVKALRTSGNDGLRHRKAKVA
jgi:hypothetical protein